MSRIRYGPAQYAIEAPGRKNVKTMALKIDRLEKKPVVKSVVVLEGDQWFDHAVKLLFHNVEALVDLIELEGVRCHLGRV